MRAGDLAPDDADLGTADLLLGLVDVGDLLAEVEAALILATVRVGRCEGEGVERVTYLAALVSSTPSILIRLVLEWVT